MLTRGVWFSRLKCSTCRRRARLELVDGRGRVVARECPECSRSRRVAFVELLRRSTRRISS